MKEDIPFEEFYNYYYYQKTHSGIAENIDELRLTVQVRNEWLDKMKNVSWEDLKSLAPNEMIQVPICWIYDWTHVTANYDLQDKVEKLYSRYNLPIYQINQYLIYFRKKCK